MRLRTAALALVLLVPTACGGAKHHTALPAVPPPGQGPGGSAPTTTAAPPGGHAGSTAPPARVRTAGLALTPFTSCPAFLGAVKNEASAEVTPYGLATAGGVIMPTAMGTGAASGGAASSAAGSSNEAAAPAAPVAAGASTSGVSGTNDQEAGVDELDTTKTDGHLLVSLRQGPSAQELQVTDVAASPPRMRGSFAIPNGEASGLFLVGSDAVVIGQTYANATPQVNPTSEAEVWVVSVANPDHPTLVRTFGVSGVESAARLIGTTVKLVVTSAPTIVFPTPQPDNAASLAANRAAIARSKLSDWLPTITDGNGYQHLADCGSVEHTSVPSGVSTISVLSIDPSSSEPGQAVTVLGNAGTVYASTTDLYVATTSYAEQRAMTMAQPYPNEQTVIHQFDITKPLAAYRGSGVVPGELLNQYSLSELNGDLRVATTTGFPSPPPFEGSPVPAPDGSQSMVTVLRPDHGTLAQVGQLGGLGRTEKIYAVRFIGTLGYVVTFRQMDPLYVVDLADPTHPALRGSLSLTGYSAYLHPVAATRLLGVGQAADANGRRQGLQVSLFDVANPANPTLVGQQSMANATAQVENDPHAFLWWAPANLVVLPLQSYCGAMPEGSSASSCPGAVVYRVTASGLAEMGTVTQPSTPSPAPGPGEAVPPSGAVSGPAMPAPGGQPMPIMFGTSIDRALVVGNVLYTVSGQGVMASDLTTLARISWLPYPSS